MRVSRHLRIFYVALWVSCYLLAGCTTTAPRQTSVTPQQSTAPDLTLAVWDFDNNAPAGSELDYLGRALSEALLAQLSATPGIRLVERVKLRQVLEEQHLGNSQLASENTRLRLGRIAGANHMAFGSFMAIANQIRLDVRVVDVETSLVKFSEDATSALPEAINQLPALAQHMAAKLAASMPGGQAAVDLALWKRYAEGIALMDQHQYAPAIKVFTEVLKSAPQFQAAEKQLRLALEMQARQ